MSLKGSWSDNPPFSKFLLAICVIFISLLLFSFIGILVVNVVYGVNMMDIKTSIDDLSNPINISAQKVLQNFESVGMFIVPAFALSFFFSVKPFSYLKLDRFPGVVSFLLVVLLLLASMPFINYLVAVNERMHLPSFLSGMEDWMKQTENKLSELTKNFLTINNTRDLIITIIMIALIPALGEELLFRGILQRIFKEWSHNAHVGIWMSAALFSALHFQFFGFLPRMLLGALLGYLLEWSGKLWLPILGHFMNNAAAVLLAYFYQDKITDIDPDKFGAEKSDLIFLMISIAFTVFFLVLIYKREKKEIAIG